MQEEKLVSYMLDLGEILVTSGAECSCTVKKQATENNR